MKLAEAIRVLELSDNRPMFLDKETIIEAVRLGVEAMKLIQVVDSLKLQSD